MKANKKLQLRVKRKKIMDSLDDRFEQNETKMRASKGKRRAGRFGRIFFIVIAALVLLFLLFNINYLTPSKMKEHMQAVFADMGHGEGYPYRFSSDDIYDFFAFSSSDNVVLTNNELRILNQSAKEVLNYKHSMSHPIAKYSRDRILLFDQGGSKAVILTQSGQVIAFPNDSKLICAAISDSGKSALATKTEEGKEQVDVYSHSGKRLMSWTKGEGYITDVAVNPSGNTLSVAILDTEDAVETINIYSFNISNAKQKGHYQIKSSAFYGIAYLKTNDLCVLCNNKVHIMNAKCVLKKEAELPTVDNFQLFCDRNGHIINVYSLYNNGKYLIDVYNASLEKTDSRECSKEVVDVSSDGSSICAVYTDKSAEVFMIGGKVTYKARFEIDPVAVVCRSKTVYSCSNGAVEKVKGVKQ